MELAAQLTAHLHALSHHTGAGTDLAGQGRELAAALATLARDLAAEVPSF